MIPATFYRLYLAYHRERKAEPAIWDDLSMTQLMKHLTVGRSFAWRVIGISPTALQKLAENNFKYDKHSPFTLTRGHLRERRDTMRELMDPEHPLSEADFNEVLSRSDPTVLCLRSENDAIATTDYLRFDNDGTLFPNGHSSFKIRKRERDFLQALHAAQTPLAA